jgi:hypothetical protein
MPANTVYSGLAKSDFTGNLHHLLIRRIAFEVEVMEFQPQFGLASRINLEVHMLKIGFDGSQANPHLKGNLGVLAPLTG